MKQAKLRAAGGNMDRQEVVEAIIAASVEAAQDGVMQRFDEIAKERGFHEGDVGEGETGTDGSSRNCTFTYTSAGIGVQAAVTRSKIP